MKKLLIVLTLSSFLVSCTGTSEVEKNEPDLGAQAEAVGTPQETMETNF